MLGLNLMILFFRSSLEVLIHLALLLLIMQMKSCTSSADLGLVINKRTLGKAGLPAFVIVHGFGVTINHVEQLAKATSAFVTLVYTGLHWSFHYKLCVCIKG